MKNKEIIIAIIATFFFVACEEEIQLDVDQTKEQMVIEGLLTDSLKYHEIRLSTSNGLYDKNGFPAVDNASVSVTEKSNNGIEREIVYDLTEKPGLYRSQIKFEGKIGNSYELKVDWKGQTYSAEDILLPVTKIDSLVAEPVEEDFEPWDDLIDSLGTETGPFYYIKFYAIEPGDRVDFYNWRFYRNGVFKNYEGRDVYYASDEIVREEIDGIYIPGVYTKGDTVYMEQFSISRIGYLYYFDLETVINSDGGMFSSAPANPRNNISNGALGFWQVSAVKNIKFIIP